MVEWFGTASDLTARKQHEHRQKLLIDELNHRVKNTLATVQSIATQTLRNASTPAAGREALEARLMALSKTHDVLTRGHWEGADIHELLARATSPYAKSGAHSRFETRGVELRLLPRAALALSMGLHELATNAVKYGALSNETGRVQIRWDLTSDHRFCLEWIESAGPPVDKPNRRGFGSRLIEQGLAQDIAGDVQLSFEREGLVCTILAPMEEIRAGGHQNPRVLHEF